MWLTVFSDASWDSKFGAAGFGAWAMREDWEQGRFMSGSLNQVLISSTEAELCGIAKALHSLPEGAFDGITHLSLQCDAVGALGMIYYRLIGRVQLSHVKGEKDVPILRNGNDPTMLQKKALDVIRKTVPIDVPIFLRHIKGHGKKSGSGRTWVNNQCDKLAKTHMRERRAILEANPLSPIFPGSNKEHTNGSTKDDQLRSSTWDEGAD